MEDPYSPARPTSAPAPIAAICPHCLKLLLSVGWLINPDNPQRQECGLVTIYHNDPDCMVALSCQMVPVERSRIQAPPEFRPIGRG